MEVDPVAARSGRAAAVSVDPDFGARAVTAADGRAADAMIKKLEETHMSLDLNNTKEVRVRYHPLAIQMLSFFFFFFPKQFINMANL